MKSKSTLNAVSWTLTFLFIAAWICAGIIICESIYLFFNSGFAWLVSALFWFGCPILVSVAHDIKNKNRRHKNILDDEF